MDVLLLYFDDEAEFAARVAQAGGFAAAAIERHRFPDGELRLRLPASLPPHVVLLRSLAQPNEKLVELLLAARTARSLGARFLSLVAPYLAYQRQDIAFHPGEAVSQRIVGDFLASLVDAVITVDPHLHRVANLQQAIPVPQALALSAASLLARLAAAQRANPVLVGPDAESRQWVEAAAHAADLEYFVCSKIRHDDRRVDIRLPPDVVVAGRAVVLLDDIASSGHTLAGAARVLLAAGAASVDVAVTHAIFAGDALALMHAAGVGAVWSTDCLRHPTNAVSVAALLVQALRGLVSSPAGVGPP